MSVGDCRGVELYTIRFMYTIRERFLSYTIPIYMVFLVNSCVIPERENKRESVSVIAEEGGSSWVSSSCIELNFVY